MADETFTDREQLLKPDDSIVIPEKEKGLVFDSKTDADNYAQAEIDAIMKAMG